MNLKQWQSFCSDYIASNHQENSTQYKRLSVYKDSILAIHINALVISFPVIYRLLGTGFFNQIATQYILHKNWRSHSIDELGCDFDEFLTQHQLATTMDYLIEVAKIEWLVQSLTEPKSANDSVSMLPNFLKQAEDVTIVLRDNVNFLHLNKGGIEVWFAHQKESMDTVNIKNVTEGYWLFTNEAEMVTAEEIDDALYEFISLIKDGCSLNSICEKIGLDSAIEFIARLNQKQYIEFIPLA